MKYQINIQGMHCSGCTNLIAMSLEDANFTDIAVDLDSQTATFESKETEQATNNKLESIFAEPDLKGYTFTTLLKA